MQRLRGLTVAIVLVRECSYKHPEAVSNLTVHEKIVEREGRMQRRGGFVGASRAAARGSCR
jgi:hypothetical protein